MRFPYQDYPIQGIGAQHISVVHRPVIPFWIFGPKTGIDLLGLIDTGADDVLIPDVYMGLLGVTPAPGQQAMISAVGGGTVTADYGTVDIQIGDPPDTCRWSARVGFYPGKDYKVLLGLHGFLEHFTATFSGRQKLVTLRPNGTFPLARMTGL